MENNGIGKLGVRVWGWPTLIVFVLQWILMAIFKITSPTNSQYFLEPDSGREFVFEAVLGFLFITYLWVLVHRYTVVSKKPLSKITKGGVIFLSIMFAIGMICQLFLYLK